MKHTDTEALVAYAIRHDTTPTAADPVYRLLIDTDTCCAALYACPANGAFSLIGTPYEASPPCSVDTLWQDALVRETKLDRREVSNLLPSFAFNEALWEWYGSGGLNDLTAAHTVDGEALPCHTITAAFAPAQQQLQPALDHVLTLLDSNRINEDHLKFVLVGRAAGYAPVQYLVRSTFTFDAAASRLSDTRFVPPVDSPREQLLQEGYALLQEQEQAGTDVILLLTDAQGQESPCTLLRKGQPSVTAAEADFTAPLFVVCDEPLCLQVAHNTVRQPLPKGLLNGDAGLIEVGCLHQNTHPVLLLRNAQTPDQLFEIPLGE